MSLCICFCKLLRLLMLSFSVLAAGIGTSANVPRICCSPLSQKSSHLQPYAASTFKNPSWRHSKLIMSLITILCLIYSCQKFERGILSWSVRMTYSDLLTWNSHDILRCLDPLIYFLYFLAIIPFECLFWDILVWGQILAHWQDVIPCHSPGLSHSHNSTAI